MLDIPQDSEALDLDNDSVPDSRDHRRGGDAALHRDFFRIVDEIENIGISFNLFTNAKWVKPQRFINRLKSINTLDRKLISLHGPNAAVHEAFSGVIGFFKQPHKTFCCRLKMGLS
jgi:hypothetical protein